MLRAELYVRTFSGFGLSCSDHSSSNLNVILMTHSLKSPNSSLYTSHSYRFSLQNLTFRLSPIPHHLHHNKKLKFSKISCKKRSHGSFNPKSQPYEPDDEFFQASLLISETVKHYHLRKQGFQGEVKQFSGQFVPVSGQAKDFRADVNSIGLGILRRFQNPTIFLKISCEGDFLLPIAVGEYAVKQLIESLDEAHEDDHGDYSNHFQFIRDLVVELGYEVKMVKLTKRVVNTYFARVYFGKVGERESFSVDARPSDAMNVAERCKAPIYVNKQIVLSDAIRIAYGTGRVRDTKPVYDVLLDSPVEGPDLLVEELNLVQNMKLAVKEERYIDAAMWKDKLAKLNVSRL